MHGSVTQVNYTKDRVESKNWKWLDIRYRVIENVTRLVPSLQKVLESFFIRVLLRRQSKHWLFFSHCFFDHFYRIFDHES